MMVDGMKEEWPHLDISISPRDDLMLNNFYKVRMTCVCKRVSLKEGAGMGIYRLDCYRVTDESWWNGKLEASGRHQHLPGTILC